MDDLYKEELLDHYKNPRNRGKMFNADIIKEDSNPLCGDHVEFYLKLKKEKESNLNENLNERIVESTSFEGKGCVICMASASILTEHLENKSLKQIQEMTRDDFLDILKLNLTPTRVKCAMLPLITIKKGIIDFELKNSQIKNIYTKKEEKKEGNNQENKIKIQKKSEKIKKKHVEKKNNQKEK